MIKADVLDRIKDSIICDDISIAKKALDDFAKQESIEFLKFLIAEQNDNYIYPYDSAGFTFIATKNEEMAYGEFVKSKTK